MKRKKQLVYPDHQPEKDKGKGRRLRGIRRILLSTYAMEDGQTATSVPHHHKFMHSQVLLERRLPAAKHRVFHSAMTE